MTEKVIEFPKNKVVREIPEEVHHQRQAKADQKLADTIVDEITGLMITELDNYYVNVQTKQFSKDLVLVADALRAAVYRSFGLEHHLHEFIDKNVTLIEGNFDDMSKEEIKEKIETVMLELSKAKENLDTDEDE
jgi:hypothetical protein